jgi:hypothetical protein
MNARELFTVGMKLIGVYILIQGVTLSPALLRVMQAHHDLDDVRSSAMIIATLAVQLFGGWYLIRGAPWIMNAAGYGKTEAP